MLQREIEQKQRECKDVTTRYVSTQSVSQRTRSHKVRRQQRSFPAFSEPIYEALGDSLIN